MNTTVRFLLTAIALLSMVNHASADSAREDVETIRAEVVLEAGEIDSSTVEVGAFAVVVYGQGERQPTSGEWAKLDTVRGYIKAVDRRRLIVGLEPDGWSKWIALERIQTLILVGSPPWRAVDGVSTQADEGIETAADRTDNIGQLDSSRKEHIQTQADSVYASGGFQATPDTIFVKTDDRGGTAGRVVRKLIWGVVGGNVVVLPGALIGAFIDDGCDNSSSYEGGDGGCIELGLFIGMGTGWILGVPIGVNMEEPNDRFIHTLGGSLGGLVTGVLLTIVDGTLSPSMIVAPIVGATLASEWSRNAELSRNPLEARGKGHRFSIGLVPDPRGNLAAVVTLRF